MTTEEVERAICALIIEDALAAGLAIRVDDEEGVQLSASKDAAAITAAMWASDENTLVFIDAQGGRVGWVYLVWGNGRDCITDNNAGLHGVLERASALAETFD